MTTKTFKNLRSQKKITFILLVTIAVWAFGFPMLIKSVRAADVSNFSDTLSDSDASVVSNHVVRFTMSSTGALTAGEYLSLVFEGFNVGSITTADVDMLINGVDQNLSGAVWGVSTTTNTVTITSGSGTLASDDAVVIYIGTNATSTTDSGPGVEQIVNPGLGSKTVALGGDMDDSGTTRVVIIDDVTVTASVDTVFTFSIAGVGTNTAPFTGDTSTTTATTTATEINFGTLEAGVLEMAAQQLTVQTNAANGFSVTIQQDTNLDSASGADINTFVDGDATSTPLVWQSPSATAGDDTTYGHYGISSEDHTLSTGDPFGAGSALFVGQFSSAAPLEVFYNSGPTNSTTTYVGIKLEISSLQEAASDYSNTLTYIATPVF